MVPEVSRNYNIGELGSSTTSIHADEFLISSF